MLQSVNTKETTMRITSTYREIEGGLKSTYGMMWFMLPKSHCVVCRIERHFRGAIHLSEEPVFEDLPMHWMIWDDLAAVFSLISPSSDSNIRPLDYDYSLQSFS